MKTKKLKLIQRVLAVLLTMTMALGIVPMTAFAAETSQAAQEAAAMRELESRVFEIGGEQLTIEDLEKADVVLMNTEDGETVSVAGENVREFLEIQPRATANATASVEISTERGQYRVRFYITSSARITKVRASNITCGYKSGGNIINVDIKTEKVTDKQSVDYGYYVLFNRSSGSMGTSLYVYTNYFDFPMNAAAFISWTNLEIYMADNNMVSLTGDNW